MLGINQRLSQGLALSKIEYLPYGETWFEEGDTNNAPKYNSQELDKETGYYFYNARHYDPEISRFVTADNVVDGEFDTQGWNRFSYVKGNPIRYKDSTGHMGKLSELFNNNDYSNLPSRVLTKDEIKEQKEIKSFLQNKEKQIDISNLDKDQLEIYKKAKSYLANSKTFRQLYNTLNNGPEKIQIMITNGDNKIKATSDEKIIYWNPNRTKETKAGETISSAVALAHEFGHAHQKILIKI